MMFAIVFLLCLEKALACTNLLISNSASTDGSNIIAYNADAANLYTTIYHYPAASHENETRKMWTWDYGTYLGEIPEAHVTYNVVGNVNEHGLIITESTFGGLTQLMCSRNTGLMDYGSLIWVTLQRAKTAREAIALMGQLVADHGYASTGESFSIGDPDEIWYMEMIGKGHHEKGAVWVARRLPDGYVTGHANQARITTFPLDDADSCLYSSDVISFARQTSLFTGVDSAFSFSDTYDPVTFSGARFCEARVWSFFGAVMGDDWSNQYLDYAQGFNLTNRMPLWVLPPASLSVQDVMQAMRNHYEGTALDTTGKIVPDVGAQAYSNPNRNRPGSWSAPSYPGNTYFNERTIGQAPTGWSIVCQSRPKVDLAMAALMWFGIDDSSTSVHFPIYGSATRIPHGWAGQGPQDGVTPPMMSFSLDSAFYVFNLVANWAYSRWDLIYPEVLRKINEKENRYAALVEVMDEKAIELFTLGQRTEAVESLTSFSDELGAALMVEWFHFFGELFVKYRDGYITTAAPELPTCGCRSENAPYQDKWYDRIVEDTGDRYLTPDQGDNTPKTIPKLSLRAFN